MRRQTTTGRVTPAGSGRGERLDPLVLTRQREVLDRTADEAVRVAESDHQCTGSRCSARALETKPHLPFAAYRGVSIRIQGPGDDAAAAVAIVLEHSNPALSHTLYRATHGRDVIAEWRAWGRALALPLLVAEAEGLLREPFARLGAVRVATPARRRPLSRRAQRSASFATRQGLAVLKPGARRNQRRPLARH